ncbi:hypothetical protein PBY51_022531 [Eleginops maclovinus]|uniref:Uncharacterized protein n=1 Tax=Eleginops maclovinus TaxID=56733 RepID=A0AAN7XHQ3_ELEMC|nr:hypothetical protein PBY51_022531 [Eleginops maclovinus]
MPPQSLNIWLLPSDPLGRAHVASGAKKREITSCICKKAVGSVKLSSPTNRTESRHQEVDFLVHQPSDVTQDRERYWWRDSEGWTQ